MEEEEPVTITLPGAWIKFIMSCLFTFGQDDPATEEEEKQATTIAQSIYEQTGIGY